MGKNKTTDVDDPPATTEDPRDARIRELEERAAKAESDAKAALELLDKKTEPPKAPVAEEQQTEESYNDKLQRALRLPESEYLEALKLLKPTKAQIQRAKSDKMWAEHPEVIFVDSRRKEWPAKICPLPINKHDVVVLPAVIDPRAEMEKIMDMPQQDQMAAFQDLQKRQMEGARHLQTGSKTFHKVCRFHGLGMYASAMPNGQGLQPTPHLLVNFAASEETEEWATISYVRYRDYVGVTTAGGGHQIPYWKFKPEDEPSRD